MYWCWGRLVTYFIDSALGNTFSLSLLHFLISHSNDWFKCLSLLFFNNNVSITLSLHCIFQVDYLVSIVLNVSLSLLKGVSCDTHRGAVITVANYYLWVITPKSPYGGGNRYQHFSSVRFFRIIVTTLYWVDPAVTKESKKLPFHRWTRFYRLHEYRISNSMKC